MAGRRVGDRAARDRGTDDSAALCPLWQGLAQLTHFGASPGRLLGRARIVARARLDIVGNVLRDRDSSDRLPCWRGKYGKICQVTTGTPGAYRVT